MYMKHETLIDHSRDPAVDGGFDDRVSRSLPGDNVLPLPGSVKIQVLDHFPYPVHAKMSPQSHIREVSEQKRSTEVATRDSRVPNNEWHTTVAIAIAHSYPQITHAPATSCPMYTCAHHGWC